MINNGEAYVHTQNNSRHRPGRVKEITSNLNKYFRYFSPRGRRARIPFYENASRELSIPALIDLLMKLPWESGEE